MGRRGILPSLGAGTSLIVAGVLCLLVVSSMIAFRGFPGLGPDVPGPPLRLPAPPADGTGAAVAKPILVGTGAEVATLSAPGPRVRRRGRDERAARTARPGGRADTPPGSSPETPPPPTSSPPAPSPTAAPPSASPASRPRPVRTAVDEVRALVPPVQAPPVPPAVQPIADQVDQTIDTVDDTVGGLLP